MPPQFIRHLANAGFGTELIYSFVIIVCSLMIYFGTKEIYELSSHKGIKYFRQAFLFFAVAYFFRSFIKFISIYINILNISPRLFGPLTLFVFMYFSSLSIFYLLYSVMWKNWNKNPNKIYLLHLAAFIIALISVLTRNPIIYLALNLLLFLFIALIVLIAYKSKKKRLNLYAIYILLFVFWIFNILDILIPNFLQTFKLLIYLISAGIFLTILYKVLKKQAD